MAMVDYVLFALKLAAALGCGLMSGVFFAFSVFVIKALGRIAPAQGIAAMQSINISVLNALFGVVFFGTAAACLVLGAYALVRWQEPASGYLLAGSLLYLIGTILVTIVFNVPLNDALAAVEPESTAASTLWTKYLQTWTAWNHVRTVAPLAAAALFMIALCNRCNRTGQ